MDYDKDLSSMQVSTLEGKLHCMRHQTHGKRLVFLHGMGSSTRAWKRLLDYLPYDYDITLIDMLGHGLSDAPEVDYTVGLQVHAVLDVMNTLGLHDCYLIGHSYGAWVAAIIAMTQKDTAGLVLEDPAGLSDYLYDIASSPAFEQNKDAMLRELKILGNKEYVIRSMMENGENPQGMLTRENLRRISAPTLLVWGTNDYTIPIKYIDIFASSIRKASTAKIQGAGHEPHYTNAKETADAIIGFIGKP